MLTTQMDSSHAPLCGRFSREGSMNILLLLFSCHESMSPLESFGK